MKKNLNDYLKFKNIGPVSSDAFLTHLEKRFTNIIKHQTNCQFEKTKFLLHGTDIEDHFYYHLNSDSVIFYRNTTKEKTKVLSEKNRLIANFIYGISDSRRVACVYIYKNVDELGQAVIDEETGNQEYTHEICPIDPDSSIIADVVRFAKMDDRDQLIINYKFELEKIKDERKTMSIEINELRSELKKTRMQVKGRDEELAKTFELKEKVVKLEKELKKIEKKPKKEVVPVKEVKITGDESARIYNDMDEETKKTVVAFARILSSTASKMPNNLIAQTTYADRLRAAKEISKLNFCKRRKIPREKSEEMKTLYPIVKKIYEKNGLI